MKAETQKYKKGQLKMTVEQADQSKSTISLDNDSIGEFQIPSKVAPSSTVKSQRDFNSRMTGQFG